MTTPIVTEIIRRPEPVDHDSFIDDLRSIVDTRRPQGPRTR
jgi:hypothetical protein